MTTGKKEFVTLIIVVAVITRVLFMAAIAAVPFLFWDAPSIPVSSLIPFGSDGNDDYDDLKEAFQLWRLEGRWTVPEKGWSFLIYFTGDGMRLRTDMFFDEATGTGMFDGELPDYDSSYISASYGYDCDNVFINANKINDDEFNSFTVSISYSDKSDHIQNDENLSFTNLTFERDMKYRETLYNTLELPAEVREDIERAVNAELDRHYYSQKYGLLFFDQDDSNKTLIGQVNSKGFISFEGQINPIKNGKMDLGGKKVTFEIDPVTYPYKIYSLYVVPDSDRVVFLYARQ